MPVEISSIGRVSDPLSELRNAVETAAGIDSDGDERPITPTLERPPKPELGDYSTNAAMLLAPARGAPPREIAETLRSELDGRLGAAAERIEVAGPGFLNLFLADGWYRQAVAAVLAAGDGYGSAAAPSEERVLIEFVSANPTGPATVASGRHAAYGDSLARLLILSGAQIEREYLVNDVGGQAHRFAQSIAARMRNEPAPEDGYAGEYVGELARELAAEGLGPDDLDALERRATEAMRARIEATLERFGVHFDTWFSERSIAEAGAVEATVAELRERGHVYDRDGAVWLRTSAFGDEKDRVLIRSTGAPTYFAADIAYHRDKLARGWERLMDPLGSDHHGYVARMRAAIAALGADPDRYEAPMLQFVHVVQGGERAQMSKRKGDFVTLDELLDDIGIDAARFFMLQRSHDSTLDLDLDLARRRSQENPVYYVQYAHARIASILAKAVRRRACRPARMVSPTRPRSPMPRPGRRSRPRSSPPSGRWSSACWSFRRSAPPPPSAARRIGSAPTRPPPRPTSTPSTGTARSSGPARASRRRGWASASQPSG